MKRLLIALALCATPADARIVRQLPSPVETAPVERAIANVAADRDLSAAQRERLLGRLHLIAYAQRNATLQRLDTGEWVAEGERCGDPAYLRRASSGLCRSWIGPPNAVPAAATAARTGATQHLRQARRRYARALALDGADLRARLGYAFVLDRLGRDEAARVQLRAAIAIALPRMADGAHAAWEDLAVLEEAVQHLGELARAPGDRDLIAEARARLGTADRIIVTATPMVVPLAEAPFDTLIDRSSSIAFDFAGTGDTRAQGWLTPDAAWLVWDPERRGDIRSGFDLIGQRTWAVFWSDGFEAMRSLDDNRDGELVGAELEGLALWRDADSDGLSDPGEVLPLASHGIAALAVRGAREREDLLVAPAGVRLNDGRTRPLYDWTPGLDPPPNS